MADEDDELKGRLRVMLAEARQMIAENSQRIDAAARNEGDLRGGAGDVDDAEG